MVSSYLRAPARAAAAMIRWLCTASGSADSLAGPGLAKPLYRRLSALGGAPAGSVAKAMDEWVQEGKRIRPIQVVKYVRELRKYKRFSQALELMEWMDIKGIQMTHSNHAIRIDLLSKASGIHSAEGYFANLPESAKNSLTYGALLNCYCRERMLEESTDLYQKMKSLGFDDSTLVYNNLGSLYLKLEQPEKIPPLIEIMKIKKIPLDTFTHCILMNSLSRLGDIEAVEKLVSKIERESEGTFPPWPIYSNLASIYLFAGLNTRAESALKRLEMVIDRKDRDSFHFLISLHARLGNLLEVNRVWRSMKSIFPKTTNLSYLVVLQALDLLDDLDSVKECYEEWETLANHHDIRLTNVVIGVYLRKKMIEDALTLWENAERRGAAVNVKTFDLFVDYYIRNEEMEQALKCVLTAASKVKREWKMSQERVDIFMRYFVEKKDPEGARKFQEILKKLNCV